MAIARKHNLFVIEDASQAHATGDPDYVKAAPALDDIDKFDAAFFGYAPREAQMMDPQHRLLLECATSALEHSGYASDTYDGLISVFAGSAMKYFNYCQGLTMTSKAFHDLFGAPPRKPESQITQREMDLARSVQVVTEEVMVRMVSPITISRP